ncbi:hypothetical protein [Bacillus cereus group sp. BfR-BA-01538]|uniref:hypothetical protein n=1 Tax=Bacillus cereus group sp. BfR-BA-01538 TaxID=2920373 RepID=UPI001F59600A
MEDYYWIVRGLEWVGSASIFTLGTLSISGGIVFIVQKIFLHALNKKEADHKSELNKREAEFKIHLDKQLEKHKSEFKKINDKYQIQFSKLHVDRAETIKKLYSKLVELESSGQNLLGPIGRILGTVDRRVAPEKMKELVSKVLEDTNDLSKCFKINRIYFPETVCESFENILNKMYLIVEYTSRDDTPTTEEAMKMQRDTDKVVAELIIKLIPKLKRSLEDEFRKLLGVTEDEQVEK